MKLGFKQIRTAIAVISLVIIVGQGVWIYNMYTAYYYQFSQAKEQAAETAILKEHNVRYEQMGGTIVSVPLTRHLDTSRYIVKTIQSADTSFQVTYDRFDPYSEMKVQQFLLKEHLPVNADMLNRIFREEMATRGFPNVDTYVEYIDLKKGAVIQTSTPFTTYGDYGTSELKVIDIFNTIGIKAYAHIPTYDLLKKMMIQLILSVILILICVFLLFAVIRTFFWRERIELMRQDSVNAMTHEFKRPISSAMAQTALIPHYLQKDQTEKVQQYASNVLMELNKLTAYTERVQRLSNNSKEHIPLNKEDIILKDFFEAIVEKYSGITEKHVEVILSLMTPIVYINADRIHFSNIIENLLENAIKYSEEMVSINVCIAEATLPNTLKIAIKDNGLGIPDADIGHIFEKFYRSTNKAVRQRVGFGLGLTYVKALVEAHSGKINVASKVGVGTEFTIYFPINDAQ